MTEYVARHISGILLPVALLIVALGCQARSPTAPPSPNSLPTAPDVPSSLSPVLGEMIDVRVEGRVIDADSEKPVSGAVVTPGGFCAKGTTSAGGACRRVDPGADRVTTDANGVFAVVANIPQTWDQLWLEVTRDGYEHMDIFVPPSDVRASTLRVLPVLTISPGGSLTTRTFHGSLNCGMDGWYCRRVIINAPPSDLIEVEVIPVEGQVGILEGPAAMVFPSQRQVTVSGREVWIYAGSPTPTPFYHVFEQRMTVTARRHR